MCTRRAAEQHSCLDPAASAAAERIAAIARHLGRAFDDVLAMYDLDIVDYRILTRLMTAAAGHASVGEFARSMTMSTGAMTNRLDRLEAAGSVVRRRDPADRRASSSLRRPRGSPGSTGRPPTPD